MSTEFKKFAFASFLFHLICAFFSAGFMHPDEHFQIIEAMNIRFFSSGGSFTWDYQEMMRPWLQPLFYASLLKPLTYLGLENPFLKATFLRIIMAVLGCVSLWALVWEWQKELKHHSSKILLMAMSAFLWFIPFLHARTSSENFSVILFFLGFYLWHFKRSFFWGSFLLMLCFFARFQMAFVLLPFLCWDLYKKSWAPKKILLFVGGMTFGLALCLFLDFFAYGKWVLTPWNYFVQNIFYHKAENFGTSPFWAYFSFSLTKGLPPLSLLFIIVSVFFWIKKRFHLLTVLTLPFFLAHCFVAHKELRFLSFLFFFIPFLSAFLWDEYSFFLRRFFQQIWTKSLAIFFIVINMIALVVTCSTYAYGPLKLYRILYRFPMMIPSVYVPLEKEGRHLELALRFYNPTQTEVIPFALDQVEQTLDSFWLTSKRSDFQFMTKIETCRLEYSLYPPKLIEHNYFRWADRSAIWALWHCGGL